jgi:hypothetical protein
VVVRCVSASRSWRVESGWAARAESGIAGMFDVALERERWV